MLASTIFKLVLSFFVDYIDSGNAYGSLASSQADPPADWTQPLKPVSKSVVAASAGVIIKEKIPAASDTDTSTKQTIQKMCEYIDAGVTDDACRWWAAQAVQRYAAGSKDPAHMCWGVWWLVKHAVKFAKDEPRLFAVGEPEALDLLIAPAVLVREKAPKEDCDGFTMLVCCLLKILGVQSVIVTVAADPDDPGRWSHVFPMALVNGGLPLDASHGKFPGWMVPRQHIFRWQAWDLSGNPVQAFPPAMNTLHGYVRPGKRMRRGRRGVGDDAPGGIPLFSDTVGDSGGSFLSQGDAPWDAPLAGSGSSTNWGSIFSNLVSGGVKAFQTSQLPSQYFTDPNTGKLIYAPANAPAGTGFSLASGFDSASLMSMLPILGIGLVALLVISSMGKK